MRKIFDGINSYYSKKKLSSTNIVLIYNLMLILPAAIFYYLIPLLLNYPPKSPEMIKELGALPYGLQYVSILLLALIIGNIFLRKVLRGIDEWDDIAKQDIKSQKIRQTQKLRAKCLNLPYFIYAVQILFVVIPATVILMILTAINNTTFYFIPKIMILLFSFVSLEGIISLILSKKIFTKILLRTYEGQSLEGKRIKLRDRIFLQILPMFIVGVLFTSLSGYSRVIEEKGDLLFKLYKNRLESSVKSINEIQDVEHALELMNKIQLENGDETKFVITPWGDVVTSDESKLSKVFMIYVEKISLELDGHVYSEDGEIQGVVLKVPSSKGNWTLGVKYAVASNETALFFLIGFIALLLLNVFILFYFSKSLSDDISLVAQALTKIAEGEKVDLDKMIPVTSNDEIGDLVIAFNKIQQLEKEHIQSIKEKQGIIMEQERLASLGQLIGGIAHNLKTPIMCLAGGLEGVKDLVEEYKDSIGDPEVTVDDHREIADEMLAWIEKMKPHCAYMSDIITAVKGQAVQLNASTGNKFTLDELVKRVDILMKHELNMHHCKMNIDMQVDGMIELRGEINNLVQIINNLVVNAIAAYEEKEGAIDFIVRKEGEDIEFVIKDYGKGIPRQVQEKLFKEMITTKGKNGTGLGLYMSYSTIKGRLNGNMWFTSEEGKGTAFHITIPLCL